MPLHLEMFHASRSLVVIFEILSDRRGIDPCRLATNRIEPCDDTNSKEEHGEKSPGDRAIPAVDERRPGAGRLVPRKRSAVVDGRDLACREQAADQRASCSASSC